MTQNCCQKFQQTVSDYLVRHRSILDVMSKLQESSAHVNRAIAKAVTTCGCLKIEARKQPVPSDAALAEIPQYTQTHLEGKLCPNCFEVVEEEVGNVLFYVAAMCELLNLDLEKVIASENERISTLGLYSLT